MFAPTYRRCSEDLRTTLQVCYQICKAKLSKDDLAEFLTTAKLDSTWRGSHHGFLLHWCSQLRAYEELADSSELYSSRQKLNLLSKAVNKIPYLREIENTQDLLGVTSPTGHTSIDFATYLALLTRAAQRDDNIRSKSHNPKHRLSQHAITYDYVDHGGICLLMLGMRLHLRVMNMKLFLPVTITTIITMMRLYIYCKTRPVLHQSQLEIIGIAQTDHTSLLSYGVNFQRM